ncbi:senescence-specific cysteine protease SAG12-like [Apium graveolens]|uniref:senescence-specific cysteine protease SAG12-like n=1 Tax=Apium graveolens TaxID=4045 RepID=UPI003D795856
MHEKWISQHGRVYKDAAEKNTRFRIFKKNVLLIEAFNRGEDKGFKLAVNSFADITDDEFLNLHVGFNSSMKASSFAMSTTKNTFKYANVKDVPPAIDWRQKGAVTPVKNQGGCSCCYAFSAVAAIEGITQIRQGKLISFSEQQIVDCDKQDRGCNGGYMEYAYGYIQQNNGITTESYYPYTGTQGLCQYNFTNHPAAKINGFQRVPENSEADLLKAVANQPISTGICGGDYRFRFYSSGILNAECSVNLDHAVTIVGYGSTSDGTKYWIVKNSWGTNWGDNGFGYLLRDVANPQGTCGIAIYATFPTI